MTALRVPGSRRVHMKSDGTHRKRLVRGILDFDIDARLYVAPLTGVSQRHARSKCLTRMVPDLLALGVSNLYLESCGQDAQDRAVLGLARAQAGAPRVLHFDHRNPAHDPLLWIPDIIAWAWGRDSAWREQVSGLVKGVLSVPT